MKEYDRPEVLEGSTWKTDTGCGSLYVIANLDDDGKLIEVFLRMGKAGGCANATTESLGRLVSRLLQGGDSPEKIVKQLKGIECHQSTSTQKDSCATAVAKVLEKYTEAK